MGEGIAGLDGRIFTVNKISAGGIYDIPLRDKMKFGIGGLVSKTAIPGDLATSYGGSPAGYMLFARLKVM